jgi:hypothetical protein
LRAFIQRWLPDPGRSLAIGRILKRDLQHLSPDHRAEIVECRRHMIAFVRDLVRTGMAEGSFDAELDPAIVTTSLFELLTSTPHWYRPGGRRTRQGVVDWYATLFLRGLTRVPIPAESILTCD